jgi:hypothetical protein
LHAREVSSIPTADSNDVKAAASMNAKKSTVAVSDRISRRLGVIRVLCLALLALSLGRISAAWSQEDEDHARLCPLLTEDLLQKVLPEVTGHGACKVFCRGCGCKGGPGYRDQAGSCVGYADIIRKCGPPPHRLCKAECAPLQEGCSHGRVWLKDLAARSGLSVRFIPADPSDPAVTPSGAR